MRALAAEMTPLGISVNAIAPPATRTGPMMAFADGLAGMGLTDDQVAGFKATIQEPEDVAPLAVFLATPEGRRLSGKVLALTRDEFTVLEPPAHCPPARRGAGPWTVDDLIAAVSEWGPARP